MKFLKSGRKSLRLLKSGQFFGYKKQVYQKLAKSSTKNIQANYNAVNIQTGKLVNIPLITFVDILIFH